MSVINILHLSDLHLSNPVSWDQSRLLGALKEDIDKHKFSRQAPDLVVFSGDLAMGAAEQHAYSPVLEFLLGLLDSLGLNENRLIICPGNHDVDRRAVGPRIPDLQGFRERAWTVSGANKLVDDNTFNSYVKSVFGEFSDLAGAVNNSSCINQDHLASSYYLRDLGLAVVTLNTATLSAGGLMEELKDQGRLFVAEKTLVTALDRLPSGVSTIVVGHHPSSWFTDDNQSIFERIISYRAIAYLSGHLHDVSPKQTTSLGGSLLHVQSGALYCGRNYWNGYALLSISTENTHARIAYRRWFEHRLGFSKAEDVGDDGVFYSSPEADVYWKNTTPQVDLVSLDRWRTIRLLPSILEKCNDLLSGTSFDTLFVPPDFEREIPYRSEIEGRLGSRVETLSLEDLITSNINYVVSASAETGKSTLLKQIALTLARTASSAAHWSIPVMIQFGSIRAYPRHIEKLLRDQLPDLPANITVSDLLLNGLLAILVDDMDVNIPAKKKALIEFVSKYPKARYIFASSTTFVEIASLQPEIVPDVPFTRIRMRPFRKGHLQILVENHGLTDPLKVDQMVERVIRDAGALNVPLTAVTGTFLIQIIREEPDSTVVNQAALIERYIEMLLQKYAPRELLPGTFDFKNKVDLLCSFAETMVYSNEYDPSENDLIEWCINYLREFGLRYSATDLVNYFVEARILERHDDRIRFRLRMFFEFFTATRMSDSVEFKDYIFDKDRYLSFINEIGFYSALNRRDKDHLEAIFNSFNQLTKDIWPTGSVLADPNAFLLDMVVPGKKTTEQELGELQRDVLSPEQIESDRRELQEGTDFQSDEQSQSVIRKKFITPQEKWTGHLMLLSGMVKHMELIKDVDKRRLLAGTLDGWVRFSTSSLGMIPELAKSRRVVFNGVTYKSTLSEDMPLGEVARRLTLYMPIAIARMATSFVGTEKLRLQLEDGIGSPAEPLSRQFFRVAILSDLGVSGIAKIAEKFASAVRGNGYLEHVFARKMYEVAVRFRLGKEDLEGVRNLVGDTFVQLNAVPKEKQIASKNNFTKAMNQQRIQIDFTRKTQK